LVSGPAVVQGLGDGFEERPEMDEGPFDEVAEMEFIGGVSLIIA